MLKRALLIGIDTYDHVNNLGGCVNDVNSIKPLLSRNEDDSPNFNCVSRASDKNRITRESLLEDVERLLAGGADVALLYFAGHGEQLAHDVSLVTQEGAGRTTGVKLSEIFTAINASSLKEVIVVLDCCFAGNAAGVPQLNLDLSVLREGVSVLTASRGDQTSAETDDGRGLFSTYLEGALEGGAADILGNVDVAGIYAYITESFNAWEQRPVFKANIDRLHMLRKVDPAVSLSSLRKLPDLFPQRDFLYPLDPSYEYTEKDDAVPEHVEIFQSFQKLRAARLLEPVDEEHLYWAAMHRKPCQLTRLGQHYWTLAQDGRI
ncbi:caspase family protein [Rhodococcus sp. BS-15]|uniref:caspase family protein n=1 Tax=Rhodococcus sp. BS-15 TaxID=1304954 RepID=UPI000FFBABF7|nr:caspase family protein [Rhodococcus sp. BS-15]